MDYPCELPKDENVVAITVWNNRVFLATTKRIFELRGDYLEPLYFKIIKEKKADI